MALKESKRPAYRAVTTSVWLDAKFRKFPNDTKLAWMLLLTHPDLNSLGVLPVSMAALAEELDMTPARFRKNLAPIFENGLAFYSDDDRLFILNNFLRHNPPDSPKLVVSWAKLIQRLPDCEAVNGYLLRIEGFIKEISPAHAQVWNDRIAPLVRYPIAQNSDTLSDTLCHSSEPRSQNSEDLDPPSDLLPERAPTGQIQKSPKASPMGSAAVPAAMPPNTETRQNAPQAAARSHGVNTPMEPCERHAAACLTASVAHSAAPPGAPRMGSAAVPAASSPTTGAASSPLPPPGGPGNADPWAAALATLTQRPTPEALARRCADLDPRGHRMAAWYTHALTRLDALELLPNVLDLLEHAESHHDPHTCATKGLTPLHNPGPWLVKNLTTLLTANGIRHWPDLPQTRKATP